MIAINTDHDAARAIAARDALNMLLGHYSTTAATLLAGEEIGFPFADLPESVLYVCLAFSQRIEDISEALNVWSGGRMGGTLQ